MTTAHANGITVGYDSFGDEMLPAVLLISGLGSQRIRWDGRFCRQVSASGFRVIRFDNRDAGLSTHFTEADAYTLDDMVADTVGLMDALGISDAHVVGRSMGGMIAQLLACDHPDRVLSLTSIMSSTGNAGLPKAAPDVMAMLMTPRPHPAIDHDGYVAAGIHFARRIAGSGFPFDENAHRALIAEELRRAYDPGGFARQIAAIGATGDIRHRIARIQAPSLIVHGMDDPLIPVACGEDTATCIPGAEWLLIEGMGHDVPAGLWSPLARHFARSQERL
ncbi:alpha/beta fold hydrolase [Luteibacter aegosomaticola]|uniref:alpha/beta fold hydrolase n=1 Tax=Luteibacter aegosomaticola TaxID=2911538 RepID=UPI001FF8D69A|nr:alpha/beta hydrolase [Luteibacter aegosomaticola]UPG89154.1 alpha/beta fold hydrolase [Luteibacter aegosomaticola]